MNQIREVIQTRIDHLIQLSEVASSVKHGTSIGHLREGYIMDFFRDLVPTNVSLTTGFVTDALGNISPQLDFIVTQKSSLPVVMMRDQLSIVPVESALIVAEVKSSLKLDDLEQVSSQNESLRALRISGDHGTKQFIVPTMILAYENQVAKGTLQNWMKNNSNTVVCCVISGDTFMRNDTIRIFEKDAFNIRHHGVLAFVATFYRMLEFLNANRDFRPNWDNYLTGRPRQDDGGS